MVTVSVNPKSMADFMAMLQRLSAETGMAEKDTAKKQAALICEDLARFTPPLVKGGGGGLTKKAETAGNEAIAGDTRKMFIAIGDRNPNSQKAAVFRSLSHAAKTNNRATFDKIIRKSSIQSLSISPIMTKILNDPDHTRAFLKAKNYLNRVPTKSNTYGFDTVTDLKAEHNAIKGKFGGRIKRGKRIGEPRLLVESKKVLDDYILERQVAVGKTKSAWLRALMSLPMPSNKNGPVMFGKDLRKATYIARHAGAGGYSRHQDTGKEYMITIGNLFGNLNGIADEANTMGLALGNRDRQMKSDMEQYLERTIRRFKAGRRS
jgi:hypothetical protein